MAGPHGGPAEPRGGARELVERELRSQVAAALTARRGQGLVALVEGPPGIGKTHVLDRLSADAGVAGAFVRRAGGDDNHPRQALSIAAQLLGSANGHEHPADSVFAQVDAWCQAGPVLLCVDDAHRLDTASIGLLRRLAWATRDLPLALLVGLRPFPARSVLDTLRRVALCRALPPLDPAEVEELAFRRVGGWPTPDLSAVLDRAAGNPLFVLRLVEDLRARGALVSAGPGRIGVAASASSVPAGLEDLVRAYLVQLDDAVLELLQAQAVLGSSATLEELAAVLYLAAGTAQETARAAARTGMVRLDGDRLVFVHDLYREVAYGALDEATRRSVHRRAAEVLVALGAETSNPQVTEHLLRGAVGRAPEVAAALREAALAAPLRTLTTGLAQGDGAVTEHAARTLEELGFALAAAYAWEECACLHAAAGDRGRAAMAMERALSTYEAIGASTDLRRLQARLRALGVRRGPRFKHAAAESGWAALTPTERQVADLVRRGLTNPEIAAHLFVSPRTVQSHVSHILTKLDLRSRVEIAARRADASPA